VQRPSRVVSALRERSRRGVEVDLDGQPWRLLPVDAVVRAGLTVGRTLDRETARVLARELRRTKATRTATRALAARDRSRHALEERLTRAGVPAGTRAETLAALERAGLVDDVRVAETRAHVLAARGYGDDAIRADLEGQGIGDEIAQGALAGLEPEAERLRQLLERHGREARTLRRLVARGFAPDAVAAEAAREPGFADWA
jgi:SOS response regulatory protein OraA/RecX